MIQLTVTHYFSNRPSAAFLVVLFAVGLGISAMDPTLRIGTRVDIVQEQQSIIQSTDPALRPYLAHPAFRGYVAQQLGAPLLSPGLPSGLVSVPDAALARHTAIFGATGGGKTVFRKVLTCHHLLRGGTVVDIQPKLEDAEDLIERARQLGLPPEAITFITPTRSEGIPGFNIYGTGLPPTQVTTDLIAVLANSFGEYMGPRLIHILTNAGILVGSHPGLSIYEIVRCLSRDDYLRALLEVPCDPPDSWAYEEAAEFFRTQYLRWSAHDRSAAVGPVLNKIGQLLLVPLCRALLCSSRNTLSLPDLWQTPQLVVLHLDPSTLGDQGATLLAGCLCTTLLRTAQRSPGPIPVLLALDEVGLIEEFAGPTLTRILMAARSQNLRLVLSTQHLKSISEELRGAILGNAGLIAAFRLSHEDSKLVAASMAAGTQPAVSRVTASVERRDMKSGLMARASVAHVIRDESGWPLRMAPSIWQHLQRSDLFGGPVFAELRQIAAASGIARLYVEAADDSGPVEVSAYLATLCRDDYWLSGPSPLSLVVSFPRPKLSGVERLSESDVARRWVGVLEQLPVQHAAVSIGGVSEGIVRVVDVPAFPRGAEFDQFVSHVVAANGQSAAEIAASLRARKEAVEALTRGEQTGARAESREVDDGSI